MIPKQAKNRDGVVNNNDIDTASSSAHTVTTITTLVKSSKQHNNSRGGMISISDESSSSSSDGTGTAVTSFTGGSMLLGSNQTDSKQLNRTDSNNASSRNGTGMENTNDCTAEVDPIPKAQRLIESMTMSVIEKSPYENNGCAEINEVCFDNLKNIMKPTLGGSDSVVAVVSGGREEDRSDPKMDPKLESLLGDTLARTLYKAYYEIEKSGILFSANWREGKIRNSNLGWIPKRQLLLCLQEHRFARGNVQVLQAVVRNLDCFDLVIDAMKMYSLTDQYPNLASNQKEKGFIFESQKKGDCYKCEIFVARLFATLQIFRQTHGISPSLTKKLKSCLCIMDKYVRPNQKELAKLKQKAGRVTTMMTTTTGSNESRLHNEQVTRKRRTSASLKTDCKSLASGKLVDGLISTTTTTRLRKIPKSKEIPESLLMSFGIMREQTQRLNHMMDFFHCQLQDHRNITADEIRGTIKIEDRTGGDSNSKTDSESQTDNDGRRGSK